MQWDEKELDTQITPNMYFWTPNSEILAKALAVPYLPWDSHIPLNFTKIVLRGSYGTGYYVKVWLRR